MIKTITKLLKVDDFYNESEAIDTAKGKYQIQTSFKGAWKNNKRWQK